MMGFRIKGVIRSFCAKMNLICKLCVYGLALVPVLEKMKSCTTPGSAARFAQESLHRTCP